MAKKGEKRKVIGLVCEVCGNRNHYTTKNTQNTPDKLALQKYCLHCRQTTKHEETKKNLGQNVVKPRKG